MLFLLSKRSLSSLLLRSTSHLRGDAISSSCSSSFSNLDGVGRSGIRTLHSLSMLLRNGHLCCSKGTFLDQERVFLFSIFRRFSDASGSGGDTPPPRLDRNFLANLWVSDMKKLKEREKRYGKASTTKHRGDNAVYEQSSDETHYKPTLQQPPVSQSM